MSSLTLVRHGQAAFFQGDGHLTPVGETQARQLAQHWLREGAGFDEVFSGTLARQVRTEQLIAESFREAGASWPEATRDPAWNEYDAAGVITGPAVPFGHPEYRAFQLKFEAAMHEWLLGRDTRNGAEPFAAFRDRVAGTIRRLMSGPSGRRVAVFTSGGPIGFTVNSAMCGPDRSFLELNWRIRNCSITGLVFSQARLTLDSFNQVGHLEPALITFR